MKELADRIVAHGVGSAFADGYTLHPCPAANAYHLAKSAEDFCSDGRVVLAMLTLARKRGYSFLLATMPNGNAVMTVTGPMPDREEWSAQVVDENDAIAILTAICDALDE